MARKPVKLMLVSYFSMLSIVTRSQPGGRVVSMRSAAITVGCVKAYLVVKPTLVEYYLSKFDPSGIGGKFPRGARVHAFPVLSDEDRDALDRVVAELSLSYEEQEEANVSGWPYQRVLAKPVAVRAALRERYYNLRFGEPGWFDVTREESG